MMRWRTKPTQPPPNLDMLHAQAAIAVMRLAVHYRDSDTDGDLRMFYLLKSQADAIQAITPRNKTCKNFLVGSKEVK